MSYEEKGRPQAAALWHRYKEVADGKKKKHCEGKDEKYIME